MSLQVEIDIPGLTESSALAIGRRADTSGAPFVAALRRTGPWLRRRERWVVDLVDLDDDPSVASETLDHPAGWPQDEAVRSWLENAVHFLATEVPGGRFSFQAGWPEQLLSAAVEVSADQLIGMIRRGDLHAGTRYVVDAAPIAG